MTATTLVAALLAANPGPAAHMALLGAVIVIGLIVFALVRLRRKREAAQAEQHDEIGNIAHPDDEQHAQGHARSRHH